jgi:hypothetical protein
MKINPITHPGEVRVLSRPRPRSRQHHRTLKRLEQFAWLMDQALTIPGTPFRLGLDGILGVLPIAGDVATGLAQALFVVIAENQFQLPKTLVRRMAVNVALDLAVGAIPLLGDLFDIHFKANTRNLALLKEYLDTTGAPDEEIPIAGQEWPAWSNMPRH